MSVPENIKERAIDYLLPGISNDSDVYHQISKLIDKEFDRLHCCVLYSLNKDFMKIISSNNLDIGQREVIITNGSLLAGTYTSSLSLIYKDDPFVKSKSDVILENESVFDSYLSPDNVRNFCW